MSEMERAVIAVIGSMFDAGFRDYAHCLRYLRVVVGRVTPKVFYRPTADRYSVDPDELWRMIEINLERGIEVITE